MNTLFSKRLYSEASDILEKNHVHPFVKGIGDGSLPVEKFAFYMKQDYVYLIDYARLFAIGAQKAIKLEQMQVFARLLHETLHLEMALHRKYAKTFGISDRELEATQPAPSNLAYTSYMLRVSQNGTLADLVACVLPCAWDYWEIGKILKKQNGDKLAENPYAEWIESYSSEAYGQLCRWTIQLMDELADGESEEKRRELIRQFRTTARYEYLFWEMVDHHEGWPV
ncbi:thiaminase II [Sporolactobacillus sp. THM7-4]|nr:thiaminase II [Sporolactobacillus sp. THM7-4]